MSTFARNTSNTASNGSSSSAAGTTTAAGSSSSASADLKPRESCAQKYLTNCKSLYSCIHCRTHLANHDELVSRSFQGNHGRAYLFNSVINISCGPAVQRQLNTGSHAVADIFCSNCERILGWKYEKAYVETQKYKEGKYIIELAHVFRENKHLELDKGEIFLSRQMSGKSKTRHHNNNNNSNNYYSSVRRTNMSSHSSLSSPMSSPTDSAIGGDSPGVSDDDDDELMFPFYDDLCASRSSYPGNLSVSHHDRARRSLYLESKPYDWKSPSSSSSSSSSSPRLRSTTETTTTTDSALSSDDLPSPSSSSASQACCHADDDEQQPDVGGSSKANKRPKHEHNNQDDSETQFKLEDDLPGGLHLQPGEASTSECRMEPMKLENNTNQLANPDKHTINFDDEEFFDCYSEHDVSNEFDWHNELKQ